MSALPGFRDFYPEDAARRDFIFMRWRETARRYGFAPYDSPPLENIELYRRKSGDELIGQIYGFTDKGGREIALRPEMTPSLARMIASGGQSLPKPVKWFSIPQLFRYERQQRGRLREHFQLNCDILGETGVAADVELVALLVDCLCAFGLTESDFRVRVSDRPLLGALIAAVGLSDPAQHAVVFAAIDKLTREPAENVKRRMVEGGIVSSQADQILGLFQKKGLPEIASEYDASPAVCERVLLLQRFFGMIEAMGLQGYAEFDLTVVRGLAYYTGIVFEAFDRKGKFRAISGGGRYDQLVRTIGGVDMPALGFGMGDVVLGELLTDRGLWPTDLQPRTDVYLILVHESLRTPLLSLAHQLRSAGLSVDYGFTESAVGKQFKTASQRGVRFAVILGPEEWQRHAVKLKNLESREETEVGVEKLQERLLETLKKG
ncbi:MAG: histidine--tRNA ligase [Verrucomicrobia bacterium]|nr:histidine--tRNA ligase [Verrucomicrobiota bacterium]